MDMQTFHPVFESGQVLTSALLNDIIGFLEPQDRATRAALSGIGIVCGLRPHWDGGSGTLRMSRGVAVTSAGHLIIEDETDFDRARRYTLPVSSGTNLSEAQQADARYPFLFDGNTQHEAFELLPVGFPASAAGATTRPLDSPFVTGKTVMLFVETTIEALKNCDINDCADKGARRRLGLRRLLVSHEVADRILQLEAEFAGRPVDRAHHPRLSLPAVRLEKLNPAGMGLGSAGDLYWRYLACIHPAAELLGKAMHAAWETYRPLLQALYPPAQFPDGPIPKHYFLNMWAALAHVPVHLQYAYAAIHDMTLAYKEFVDCAARFDAECAPNADRFPRHVFAGDVVARPHAFDGAPASWAAYLQYEARNAGGGPVPEGVPTARRHHFIPSAALDAAQDRVAELRALFSRLVLLGQTFATRELLNAGISLTPSRDGDASLGERAIPFYYPFDTGSDLFANWSWRKARTLRFDEIHSAQFSPAANSHPLLMRQDDTNFIRIEGVLGKPLGSTMATLIREKRRLGQGFSIQPVWLEMGGSGQTAATQQRFRTAMQELLLCRAPWLNANFRAEMRSTFDSMAELVQELGKLDATRATRRVTAAPGPTSAPTAPMVTVPVTFGGLLKLDSQMATKQVKLRAEILSNARAMHSLPADTVKKLAESAIGGEGLAAVAVANIYAQVRDKAIGGELIDRVRTASLALNVDGEPEELVSAIYPSIALMARAEEMMEVSRAASLADFDAAAFDRAQRGLAEALSQYAQRAEVDPAKAGRETAAVNAGILQRLPELLRPQLRIPQALGPEQEALLTSLLAQHNLAGFARAHPALEHKGGVPAGGSFVLLCAARADVEKELAAVLEKVVGSRIAEITDALFGDKFPVFSADSVRQLLAASRERSRDPLDDFIILGDFCLPYLCCENQCAEDLVDTRIGDVGKPRPTPDRKPMPAPMPIWEPERKPEPHTDPVADGKATPLQDPAVSREKEPTLEPKKPVEPRKEPEAEPKIPSPVAEPRGRARISVSVMQKGKRTPSTSATVKVTDAKGNTETLELSKATHSLELKPGTYFITATQGKLRSKPSEVEVRANDTAVANLIIGA